MRLRVGTRRSRLARLQTDRVCRVLERAHPGLQCEPIPMETTGDTVRDRPLREVGGKGLFVKELDEALLAGAIDCAVHSLKDVPSELHQAVALAAIPERASVSDLWICRKRRRLDDSTDVLRVGTTSLRRAGQLKARNPNVEVGMLRGNVETRVRRVREGDFDATLLAAAGLARLGVALDDLFVVELDPWDFVPAPGQGALGVTARAEDASTLELLGAIDDRAARSESLVERTIANRLGGACDLPLGALARVDRAQLRAVGIVAAADGSRTIRSEKAGPAGEAQAIGEAIAAALVRDGALALLQTRPGEEH